MTQRRNLTEDAVVTAALTLARTDGLDAVTLSSVARALNIKPQSMYRYANDVDDLRTKVIVRNLHDAIAELYRQLIGLSGKAAILKLATLVTAEDAGNGLQLSDLGIFSRYRRDARIQQEFQQFYQLVTQLLSPLARTPELLRQQVQLIIDLLFGQAATAPVANTPAAALKQDFQANLELVIKML